MNFMFNSELYLFIPKLLNELRKKIEKKSIAIFRLDNESSFVSSKFCCLDLIV